MPPETIVYSVEDDQMHLSEIREYLEAAGHTLVGSADNEEEAIAAFDTFTDLGVAVVTIDDYLSGGRGRVVAQELKKRFPDIKILALATAPTGVIFFDEALNKDNMEMLGEIVTKL